jgi:hypothetical protein
MVLNQARAQVIDHEPAEADRRRYAHDGRPPSSIEGTLRRRWKASTTVVRHIAAANPNRLTSRKERSRCGNSQSTPSSVNNTAHVAQRTG